MKLPEGTVELQQVSKSFRRQTAKKQSYTTVKSSLLSRFIGSSSGDRDKNLKEALKSLSVTVPAGSALGVIGRNGSGKSTLLKLIAGIYRPDSGKVVTSGRISALIELGAGFHPDFTGRENIYLGGVMYGLSRKEIDRRFNRIVRFAELEESIDDPVKTYSSGMYMRLGFSLAVHTDPDILLVDEVLAVGDAPFVHRCHEKISDLKRRGKTLIFVAHDLDAVSRWCDEAIWLEHGVIRKRGEPRVVIDSYLQDVERGEEESLRLENTGLEQERLEIREDSLEQQVEEVTRWGNGDVEIERVKLLDSTGEERWIFHDEESLTVEVHYSVRRAVRDLVFGIGILRADGMVIHGVNTDIDKVTVPDFLRSSELGAGSTSPTAEGDLTSPIHGMYRFNISRLGLTEQTYYVDVAAHATDGTPYDYHHLLHKFSVRGSRKYHGAYNPPHSWDFSETRQELSPPRVELAGGERR